MTVDDLIVKLCLLGPEQLDMPIKTWTASYDEGEFLEDWTEVTGVTILDGVAYLTQED